MKRLVQSRTGEHGTCFRTALASILNLKEADVPDFPEANQDPGVDRFLKKYGLRYEEVPINLDDPTPLGYHFILGLSPRGGQHAVVAENGKLVHDPHPQDGTGRGLVDAKAYGLLLPLKGSAKDTALLKGKRLHTAAEKLYEKHDEIDWNLERRDWMHNKGPESAAYAATHQGIVNLVTEASRLLQRAALDDDPAYWQLRLQKATEAIKKAEQLVRSGDYKQALAYQDTALSFAHMVIDKMRNTGRAKDAELFGPFFKGLLKSKDLTELEWRALSKPEQARLEREYEAECARARRMKARAALHSKAKDALDKRARMHRALDCVMDRSFGKAKDAGETWKELIQKHFKLTDEQFYNKSASELDKMAGQLQMAGTVAKPKGKGLYHPFTR